MKGIFGKGLNIILSLTLICSLSFGVSANETTSVPTKPDDYYVYDMADVISDSTSEEIALINKDDLKEYGEIVIVTLNSVTDTTLALYAEDLFSQWELGGSDLSAALLVMDIEGDYYRSIIGSGFSSYVSESQLQDILDGQVEYYFNSKDYDSAASVFSNAILSKIIIEDDSSADDSTTDDSTTDDSTLTEDKSDETSGNVFVSILFTIFKVLLIVILIALIIVVGFLILVNIRAEKRRKQRKQNRRNRQGK